MGSNLKNRINKSDSNECLELLNLNRPEIVKDVHLSFLEAGCNIIKSNTFCANFQFLKGQENLVELVNVEGARIARSIADSYGALTVGSMGPMTYSSEKSRQIIDSYSLQARSLINGGVQGLLLETCFDYRQIHLALAGIKSGFQSLKTSVPVLLSFFLNQDSLKNRAEIFIKELGKIPLDIVKAIGVNCISIDEPILIEALKILKANIVLPIFCFPNAGLPEVVNNKLIYPIDPEDFNEHFQKINAQISGVTWGGCCGTKPEHLKRIIEFKN